MSDDADKPDVKVVESDSESDSESESDESEVEEVPKAVSPKKEESEKSEEEEDDEEDDEEEKEDSGEDEEEEEEDDTEEKVKQHVKSETAKPESSGEEDSEEDDKDDDSENDKDIPMPELIYPTRAPSELSPTMAPAPPLSEFPTIPDMFIDKRGTVDVEKLLETLSITLGHTTDTRAATTLIQPAAEVKTEEVKLQAAPKQEEPTLEPVNIACPELVLLDQTTVLAEHAQKIKSALSITTIPQTRGLVGQLMKLVDDSVSQPYTQAIEGAAQNLARTIQRVGIGLKTHRTMAVPGIVNEWLDLWQSITKKP